MYSSGKCYLPPADCWSCRHRSPRVACCPTPRPQGGWMSRRHPRNKIKTSSWACSTALFTARFFDLAQCQSIVGVLLCNLDSLQTDHMKRKRFRTCLIFLAVMMWLVLYVSISWASVGRNKAQGQSRVVADAQIPTETRLLKRLCLLTEQTEVVALRQPRHTVAPLVEEVKKLQRFARHDFRHRARTYRSQQRQRVTGEQESQGGRGGGFEEHSCWASSVAKQLCALPHWRLLMTQ